MLCWSEMKIDFMVVCRTGIASTCEVRNWNMIQIASALFRMIGLRRECFELSWLKWVDPFELLSPLVPGGVRLVLSLQGVLLDFTNQTHSTVSEWNGIAAKIYFVALWVNTVNVLLKAATSASFAHLSTQIRKSKITSRRKTSDIH